MKTDLEFIALHDCRDRRRTSMNRILDALDGFAADGEAIARGQLSPALGFDLARRARKMKTELAAFGPRDLLSTRRAQ